MRNVFATARQAGGSAAHRVSAVLLALSLWVAATAAGAQTPIKGDVNAVVENGFARLLFTFSEEVEAQVRVANNILTINFPRPVEISIDRISSGAAGYVSAARRDPDGKGIRIALARRITMNSMAAGERLFVDLLPDTWTGLAPGLPRDVIEELARRARDAERRIRQQRALATQTRAAPVRVRAIAQPTFTRYVFDLPELIGVSADNARDRLTLTFDAMLRFDLADAKATLPPAVESIDSEVDHDAVLVRFNFNTRVDVRTFREDNSFVVDVESTQRPPARADGTTIRSDDLPAMMSDLNDRPGTAPPAVAPPKSVPARKAPVAPPPIQAPVQPPQQPAQIPPLPVEAPPAAVPATVSPPATAPAPPAVVQEVRPAAPGDATVRASFRRNGEHLSVVFPFTTPTPAAIFRRADTVWLVLDTDSPVAVGALAPEQARIIKAATVTRVREATLVRFKLERPQLISVAVDDNNWVMTLGNEVVDPTRALLLSRNVAAAAGRSTVSIAIDDVRNLHRIEDPDVGDALYVITATGPARGLVKTQDFVEFRALASAHGIALQPLADDLNAELSADKVVVSRPGGLSLSTAARSSTRSLYQRQVLDSQSWGFDRQAEFAERRTQLLMAAADSAESRRLAARCDLARFYLARDMFVEAKAVLDVALSDAPPTSDESAAIVLRAIANIMISRPDAALKDLSNPFVGNQHDAPLWRALAQARLGRWTEARESFRQSEAAMTTLPVELQRVMLRDMVRVALEVGDVTGAASRLNEFEMIGAPRELEPTLSVLSGRLAEALGRTDDALRAYRAANDSWDRPVAAQGRLREIQLHYGRGNQSRTSAIADLETLTTVWRGDQTEIEALQLLARLYTEEGRFRDAFNIMRTALRAYPNAGMTRLIQDEAMSTFDTLFLAGKGDALPAIDALALFYDFRELTPVGRRGDEMIRRLADRLVAVDLLYQASELLQHQVDHRLQGSARAQVAARLAVVYMMDRKPDKALATLRATRISELNNDLRNQRLLLEARALSALGRHDVAYEIVANIPGRETIRLRSDILWAAKRWAPAAEQLELMLGDRWQEFAPLSETERIDIMRAAIGYALGDDSLGIARFRERYLSKMGETPDASAFELVTAPIGAVGTEFAEIARGLAASDTLEAFLRDLRQRYPETGAMPPGPPQAT